LRSIDNWPLVLKAAERSAFVIAASPAILGEGFAVRAEGKNAVVVRGVEAERFLAIIDVRKRMLDGRFDIAGGDAVIGAVLADELGVRVGDKLRLTTTEGVDDVVAITGVFSLGNEAVDRTWVIVSLRRAQTLYALPGGATSIELKVADVFAAENVASELRGRTGLQADSWMKVTRFRALRARDAASGRGGPARRSIARAARRGARPCIGDPQWLSPCSSWKAWSRSTAGPSSPALSTASTSGSKRASLPR
jgi:lipoprotein-releasing system permease protein